MMRIGIVIPTRDRPNRLIRALDSIRAQRRAPDEIIVVDDCSDRAVDASIFSDWPSGTATRLLHNERPSGANAARNAGIAQASCDYVAFLDDDDEFHEDKIASIADLLAADAPDVVHHRAEIVYDNEGVTYSSKLNHNITFQSLLIGNKVGSTSLGCVRRDLLERIGGFDPQLPALQDWDLWLRAARAGARFHGIDQALTRYHFVTSEKAISKSVDKLERALALIDAKHARELDALAPAQKRQRRKTDIMRYAHRHALSNERAAAARAYLMGGLAIRSLDLVLAAPVALLGIGPLAALRAKLRA